MVYEKQLAHAPDGMEAHDAAVPYYHWSEWENVGSRFEGMIGFDNTQGMVGIRLQFLGLPGGRTPLNATLDLSGSVTGVPTVGFTNSGVGLGITVSPANRGTTPYLAARLHGGNHRYWWDPDDDGPQGEDREEWFVTEAYFLGFIVERAMRRPFVIEIYHQRLRDPPGEVGNVPGRSWGMSIVFGK